MSRATKKTSIAPYHRIRSSPASSTSLAAVLTILLAALVAAGCQAYARQQQQAQRIKVEQDRISLSVYTSDLTVAYQKLGTLSYTDPLNGDTIDTDHINEKLRTMAIARWGQQVDAIILVKTKIGGGGTTISVSGEGVRLTGICPGCRHNYAAPAV